MILNIKDFNLRIIANSGQCFRINEVDDDVFDVITTNKFLRIVRISDEIYDFKCSKTEYLFYKDYFDLKSDYNLYKSIPKSDDAFLKKCITYGKGLRILNQDKFETIISFIISQRKSIKAIKTSIERLCRLAGNRYKTIYGYYYTFPTASQILKLSKGDLKSCGLGYRIEYIIEFCKRYSYDEFNFKKMEKLSSDKLISKLMTIKGVGIKVASCIALFAFHRLDICPRDVWINRVIDKRYKGKIPKSYEKYLGIIQQYWFNYVVNQNKF